MRNSNNRKRFEYLLSTFGLKRFSLSVLTQTLRAAMRLNDDIVKALPTPASGNRVHFFPHAVISRFEDASGLRHSDHNNRH
jgi:hypothetical protein